MDDTVKLIIEIPKSDYEEIKKVGVFTCPRLAKAIREAATLDDVRSEIEFEVDHRTNMICAEVVLEILDNIGKGESEGR